MIYEFDNCVLDTATQELRHDGDLVAVEPQVLAVLEYLVSNHDRVVTKIELLDEVWGDRFVSESALTSRIKLARKACGDSGRDQRIVKTVHGRGYRVVAAVEERRSGQAARRPKVDIGLATGATTSVVGRDAELAELESAISDVEGGRPRFVYVVGEPGAGKSTLLAELIERNEGLDAWLVLRGRCLRTRSGVEPYFALLDALGELGRTEPELVTTTLEAVAPSWLAQFPSLVDDETAGRLERRMLGSTPQRMLREGADAFERLTHGQPVALMVEDLHWADECTVDVLAILSERASADLPLLVVGTTRPDPGPTASLIDSSMGAPHVVEMRLGRLDRTDVESLLRDRFRGADPPADLVSIVDERCDGVPLFAQELITSWLDAGHLTVDSSGVTVEVSLEDMLESVPRTLVPLIELRLAELDPADMATLEAAAVAGVAFDGASVAAGLDRSIIEAEEMIGSMAGPVDFVVAQGGTTWPDGTISTAYSFSHQLYRDVVYERTPAGRRAELHARIGAALEHGFRARLSDIAVTLADHFVHGGDGERAIEHLRRAGEQAATRNAHDHAVEFFAAALDRVDGLASGSERDEAELRARISMGPSLVATRGWIDEAVSANYERAMELSGDDPGRPEASSARYGMATVTELRGEFERTEELLSPLLDDAAGLAMEAHELVACSTFHQGAFQRSERTAGHFLDHWDEDDYSVLMARIAEHPASSCNSWMSMSSWFLGRSDESLEAAERAVVLGEKNLYALATATSMRAMLHQVRNEPQPCLEWALRTRDVGREQDFPMRVIQADVFRGWALGVSGSAAQGSSLIADGLDRFRQAGARLNEAYYLALHADTLLHEDRHVEALELIADALRKMRSTTRSYFHESEVLRLKARALVASGGVEDARLVLDESLAVAESLGSPALMLRTVADRLEVESGVGEPEPARARLKRLLEGYEGQAPTPDTERARELLTKF